MDGRISIIGIAGRFPGDLGLEEFWSSCVEGTCLIDVEARPEDEGTTTGTYDVRAGGRLRRKSWFDCGLFNISPGEARTMSAEQRLFLSVTWEALMDAGFSREQRGDRVGIFASGGEARAVGNGDHRESTAHMLGREPDYLGLRASYKLGLSGPSVSVSSACSSSLVAVHMACNSLLSMECDVAVAGGVNLLEDYAYEYVPGSIKSSDGYCRVFDSRASGTVFSDGVAAVVLCREADAVAYDDRVYAAIVGSAVNNDGRDKSGFTAPSVDGQVRVIANALESANVHPESIGFIEAHGTGTLVGDPVEVEALRIAYKTECARSQKTLGSVKANIGHLGRAAGVCGLVHAALCVFKGVMPPQALFVDPNPLLELDKSGFIVPTVATEWASLGEPRRSGVSSFGFGGTNCHMIIEETRDDDRKDHPDERDRLLLFSGRTKDQAVDQMTKITGWLSQERRPTSRVAKTLACGRSHEDYRLYLLPGESTDDAEPRATLSTPNKKSLELYLASKSGRSMDENLLQGDSLSDYQAFLSSLVNNVSVDLVEVFSEHPEELASRMDLGRSFSRNGMEWTNDRGKTIRFSVTHRMIDQSFAIPTPENLNDSDIVDRFYAELWRSGFLIDWHARFRGIRTVSLPDGNPSNESELDPVTETESSAIIKPAATTKNPDLRKWLYAPSWSRISAASAKVTPLPKGPWIILWDEDDPWGLELASMLKDRGADVIVAGCGEDLVDIRLRNHSTEEYARLLKELRNRMNLSHEEAYFVHTWATVDLGDYPVGFEERVSFFEHAQERAFYDLLSFGQALKLLNWTENVRIVAVGTGLSDFAVNKVEPDKTTIFGPLRVLPQELPSVSSIAIDTTVSTRYSEIGKATVLWAAAYVRDASLVAVDSATLWKQTYQRLDAMPGRTRLRPRGVYLITGGIGGIGMTLAEYFAKEVSARLILTGLSEFPARENWSDWIASRGDTDEISKKIQRIRTMEGSGAKITVAHCDVTDVQGMRALIAEAEQQYGALNGVVHAAGIFETQRAFRGIDETSRADCVRRFLPKVHGTLALASVLDGSSLDFCLMQSSLSAILGGIGFIAYTSGNAFMDAFAQRYQGVDGLPWMSINWDGWNFRGADEDAWGEPVLVPGFASTSVGVIADLGIRPHEGGDVLDILLKWGGLEQVAVSSADLSARLDEWISLTPLRQSQKDSADTKGLETRNVGLDEFIQIVQDLIERDVAPNDNFFGVGGDSLIGVDLVSRVGEHFGVIPSVVDLFENPTIEAMYGVVQRAIEEAESVHT